MTPYVFDMPEHKFVGLPCNKCGSAIRYIDRKACVQCTKRRSRKSRVKRGSYEFELPDVQKTERRRNAEDLILERELKW